MWQPRTALVQERSSANEGAHRSTQEVSFPLPDHACGARVRPQIDVAL